MRHRLAFYRPQSEQITTVSLFSSRPNWDPHPPSPAGECVPSPIGSGWTHIAVEGWGGRGFQFGRGGRHCGTLGIYVLYGWLRPPSRKIVRISKDTVTVIGCHRPAATD